MIKKKDFSRIHRSTSLLHSARPIMIITPMGACVCYDQTVVETHAHGASPAIIILY